MAKTISGQVELNPGDKILISRSDRLGDLILALPFIESIAQRFPKCQIDVLASLYASPILENNKYINGIVRVLTEQLAVNKRYRKEIQRSIKMEEYKAVVVLYPERHVSRMYYKAGIPIRIGTAGRFHSVFFSHHLLHTRKANKKHECEYNLDFLQFFDDGPTVTKPTVYPSEKELANARRILSEFEVGEKFVVLHPGSGGSAEPWPLESFIELYEVLEKEGCEVIITGSEDEGKWIRRGAEAMGIKTKAITGETDLRTLAALLSLANVVVANSTGPLHLAVAVKTKVVGLYPGKKGMSPVRWGPLGTDDIVIQPQHTNCECPPNQCRCMKTISVEEVKNAIKSFYRGEKAGQKTA